MTLNKVISDVDAAWAAGFLDGEGYFTIERKRQSRSMNIRITAAQIDATPLLKLQDLFGGHVVVGAEAKGNWNKSYVWAVASFKAANVIEIIQDYLVVKEHVASLLLSFQELLHIHPTRGHGNSVTDQEYAMRLIFLDRVKVLNSNGRKAIGDTIKDIDSSGVVAAFREELNQRKASS